MIPAMTPERWSVLQSVFDRISDLPLDERERALKESCPDPEIEHEVRQLIEQLEEARSWLEEPPTAACALRRDNDDDPPRFQNEELVSARFEIVRLLGRGGMGEVYEVIDKAAIDEGPGSRVALKTLRASLASDARAVVRFRRELFRARQVTHSNVCRLHEVFVEKDSAGRLLLFFTMELLSGRTLSDLLRSGRIPSTEALCYAAQIAAGLDAAHSAGIIHCDMKPGNIIISGVGASRRAVITDFGLALTNVGTEPITQTLAGTPAYMAPELLRGERASTASDIYSLGLIASEMLFGRRPNDGDLSAESGQERVWARAIRRCTHRMPRRGFQARTLLWRRLRPSPEGRRFRDAPQWLP
jgi:eukaryotic-like serine/threonine-protein kinase